MVAYFYKENKKVSLTPEKRSAICGDIKGLFKRYYKDLNPSRKETAEILKSLFPDMNEDKMEKIPDLYQQYQTYISAIYRACMPSYEAIVDINGLDYASNSLASTYKASLIYDWYNIDLQDTLVKALNDWAIKGESAFYVQWKSETYQQTQTVGNEYIDDEGKVIKEEIKVRENIPIFECVDVKYIDPHSLYFDKSQVDDWENCRKIYRDFVPLEQILANENYDLTPEDKKALKELVKNSDQDTLSGVTSETVVYGNTVEVLEFEGTYTLPDSIETLRRMEITVIAGKFLSQFKESDKPQTPFIWDAYLKRPDTGRGQSPLKIPSIINTVENMVMDLVMTCYHLVANPPYLTAKGSIPYAVDVKPGMPVEYDNEIMQQPPVKMDFSGGLQGYNVNNYLTQKMQDATGVTQYMQGSQDGSVRTASEASYIHSGASMRMAYEAMKFSRILYHLVRKYALFKKVFDDRDMEVDSGNGVYKPVDEAVRSGNYKFIIGGSQSAMEREAETQKIFQLFGLPVFQTLAQVLSPPEASELLKWAMNRLNLQGTSQVVEMLDNNQALQQLAKQMGIQDKNIPEFRQDFQQYVGDNTNTLAQHFVQQMLEARRQGGIE